MVVGGSRQETLDPGFVLDGARQLGVPVILRELVLLADSISYQPATQVTWFCVWAMILPGCSDRNSWQQQQQQQNSDGDDDNNDDNKSGLVK
ncbi:unnamed protein product [Schistosoma curassoni]|uniref:UDP-Glycosyltransferase superfamily protein n=1 Tax=Schistosoma curassoni TaxID=6186 RepID=A0A183KWR4_9TREM|nr:unnamed protein product [Schistosoma curassoni]